MNSNVFTPFTEKELVPQEERLEVIKKGGIMTIGVPKESSLNENRVPITPDAVQVLTQYGYKLMIESEAGKKAFFNDLEYSEAGAFIVDKVKAFEQDLVLKVSAPSLEEIELLKPNSYIISALQINLREKEYFKKLSEKKINAIAYEFIEDENKEQMLVKLIGEIAGGMSVLCASEMLAVSKGLMLGGITGVRPVEVVVLGADIVEKYPKFHKQPNFHLDDRPKGTDKKPPKSRCVDRNYSENKYASYRDRKNGNADETRKHHRRFNHRYREMCGNYGSY